MSIDNKVNVKMNTKKIPVKESLLERATRLELATNSLEGCDSSQLSYTRMVFWYWYLSVYGIF